MGGLFINLSAYPGLSPEQRKAEKIANGVGEGVVQMLLQFCLSAMPDDGHGSFLILHSGINSGSA